MNDLVSLRSRRQHKAWGASPGNRIQLICQPVITGDSVLFYSAFAHFAGFVFSNNSPGAECPRLYAVACFAG